MRQTLGITIFALMVACIPLGAATMPTIIVTNRSDSMVQITPIDDTHKAPPPLDQMTATLPPGAFILANQTNTPINALVVLWTYIDRNGNRQEKRFNCDGYIVVPPSTIVNANDSALISPGGCVMREHFPHMIAGKPMAGGQLFSSRNKSVSNIAETLTTVRITVDSVIFGDGRIWGPDARQYYKSVSAAYWAIRSVLEDVSNATAAGQNMNIPLERIRAETAGKGDQPSVLRNLYAGTIHDSPHPEATLKHYKQLPPLPEFQHVGGETK